MVVKHLSVRSVTSSDVSPLVSIGGRTSTLILPGDKKGACEKPTHHRVFSGQPQHSPQPLPGLQASIPGAQADLDPSSNSCATQNDPPVPPNCHPTQSLPRAGGSNQFLMKTSLHVFNYSPS